VLSDRPPITSTIGSLSPQLLETLLTELSSLASVYHKPPEAFLGQGRYGAEAMQKAAIEYVTFSSTFSRYANKDSENKNKTQSRTLSPLSPPLSQEERRNHNPTWRTFWILTLMVQPQPQYKRSLPAVHQGSRASLVLRKEWLLLQSTNLRLRWMTCWVYLETAGVGVVRPLVGTLRAMKIS